MSNDTTSKKTIPKKNSLKTIILISILLAAIVPAISVGVAFYVRMSITMEEEQLDSITKELELVELNINSIFEEVSTNIRYLANLESMKKLDSTITAYTNTTKEMLPICNTVGGIEGQIYKDIKKFQVEKPLYDQIYVGVESNGGFLCSPLAPVYAGFDARVRPWYVKAKEARSKPVMGKPYLSNSGEYVEYVSQGVLNDEGDFVGVVGIDLSLKTIAELFNASKIKETGYFLLIGEDTTILADPSNTNNNFKLLADAYPEEFIDKKEAILHSGEAQSVYLNGKECFVTGIHDAKTGWYYVGIVPYREIMAKAIRTRNILFVVMAFMLLAAIIAAILLAKSIANPILKCTTFVKQLAEGDLTFTFDGSLKKRKDETGIMANALSDMKDSLTNIIANVQSGSSQIAIASQELASGNQDLSTRTEQQASALEETAAAIEEVTASIKATNDNIQTAARLNNESVHNAKNGTTSLKNVIVSMNNINTSSRKISEITDVIDNIAFQTNLLALNASIEAARAGEYGKGFAVVAVEVRKLAKNSEKAAKEISRLISESTEKVEEGVTIANEAGDALKTIEDSIFQASAVTAEIAAASNEQISSISQIDSAVENLDQNTQKNAAMVEESASATEELSAQAEELSSQMQFFKVDLDDNNSNQKLLELH